MKKDKKDKFKVIKRNSVSVSLDDGWHKDHDFIEVTEWANREGWDVTISESQCFSLHFTEWDQLKKIIKYLDNIES